MSAEGFEVDTLKMLGDLIFGEPYTPVENVEAIEMCIEKAPHFPGSSLPVRDYVSGGVYVRELFMPKGILATGIIHTRDHAFVSDGDINTYDGNEVSRLTGRTLFSAAAGAKRAAYALEDSYVTTMHPQEGYSKAALEDEVGEAMNKRGII